MPKINSVRLINLVYNGDRHINDMTLDFDNCENALVNLINGGGKTFLVQTMMQPICPLIKLQGRSVKNYFKDSIYPSYILINWTLDNDSGCLITGICIRKVNQINSAELESDKDETNIRYFTFTIKNKIGNIPLTSIPLTNREEGVIKIVEYDKARKIIEGFNDKMPSETFTSEADDKKKYIDRLSECKIYVEEWKTMIASINEDEGNLEKVFTSCKTSASLFEKMVIPRIHQKLNRNYNYIDNFISIIKNHANSFIENKKHIKEKSVYNSFIEEMGQIVEKLKELQLTEKSIIQAEQEIFALYDYSKTLKLKINNEIEFNTHELSNVNNEKKALQVEELSYKYHISNDKVIQLDDEIITIEENKNSLDGSRKAYEHKKNVIIAAGLSEKIKPKNLELAKLHAQRDKLLEDIKDKNKYLLDINNSIRIRLEEQVKIAKEKYMQVEGQFNNKRDLLKDKNAELKNISHQLGDAGIELALLNKSIEDFLSIESKINATWSIVLNRNYFTGKYEENELGNLIIELNSEVSKTEEQISLTKTNQNKIECDIRETNSKIEHLERNINDSKGNYLKFDAEYKNFKSLKKQIENYLGKYNIPLNMLYNTQSNVEKLTSIKQNFKTQTDTLIVDIYKIEKELENINKGVYYHAALDVIEYLTKLNISFKTGIQWLQDVNLTCEKKNELLGSNPFLPYSIILSDEADLEILKNQKKDFFNEHITPIIPVKRIFDLSVNMQNTGYLCHLLDSDIYFMTSFFNEMIDKEQFANYEKRRKIELGNKKEQLISIQKTISDYEDCIKTINTFNQYDEDSEAQFINNIENIQTSIVALTKEKDSCKEHINELFKNSKQIIEEKNTLDNKRDKLKVCISEIKGFKLEYQKYLENYNEHSKLQNDICNYKKLQDCTEEEISLLNTDVDTLKSKRDSLKNELNGLVDKYREFATVKSDIFIEKPLSELIAIKQAHESSESSDLDTITNRINIVTTEISDLNTAIFNLGLTNNEYLEEVYNEELLNSLGDKIKVLDVSIASNTTLIYDKKIIKATEETRRTGLLESIQSYGKSPMEKEDIKKEFDIRGNRLADKEKELNKNIKDYGKRLTDVVTPLCTRVEDHKNSITINDFNSKYLPIDPTVIDDITIYQKDLFYRYEDRKKRRFEVEKDIDRMYHTLYAKPNYNNVPLISNALSILNDSSIINKFDHDQVKQRFIITNKTILDVLEKYDIDIDIIEKEKDVIVNSLLSYSEKAYKSIEEIDRIAYTVINGSRKHMLEIKKDVFFQNSKDLLKSYLNDLIDVLENESSINIDQLLKNKINTYKLLDEVTNLSKIKIKTYKVEYSSEKSELKEWEESLLTSGGEKFVAYFVLFASLLSYLRTDSIKAQKEDSKVIIMDNPFAKITSAHLLKPFIDMAAIYNTQLICLSDNRQTSVTSAFDIRYVLKVVPLRSGKGELLIIQDKQTDKEVIEYGKLSYRTEQLPLL